MNCLVDSDALIALSKDDDLNHGLAKKIAICLDKQKVSQVLSPLTLAEASTAMSRKVGQVQAVRVVKRIRLQNLGTLILKDERRADKWFIRQTKKKAVSYFDCYNMALLEEYRDTTPIIFSFDKIYQKNGFKLASQLLVKE
jgi:predicted nucleic acid-binding protein